MRRAMDVLAGILSSSQVASGTRSDRKKDAHSVSYRFRPPSYKRFTAGFDTCGKLPIIPTGFRSSSVVRQLARLLRLQPDLRPRTNLGEHVKQTATCHKSPRAEDFCHHNSPSRIISPCADGTGRLSATSCKLGNPCVFGLFCVFLVCVHFSSLRNFSTAAALPHDHVRFWCYFTFESLGFFETFGSDDVVTHCTFHPFPAVTDVRD